MVCAIPKDYQLFANRMKCVIGRSRIQYLDHWISCQGVEVDGEKIQTMVNWPQPKVVSGFKGFLGLTNYYRRFLKGVGILRTPHQVIREERVQVE